MDPLDSIKTNRAGVGASKRYQRATDTTIVPRRADVLREYCVTWTIDLDASSPEEAARLALEIQRDPTSIATVFDVHTGTGRSVRVDLGKQS